MTTCPYCAETIHDSSTECMHCGKKMKDSSGSAIVGKVIVFILCVVIIIRVGMALLDIIGITGKGTSIDFAIKVNSVNNVIDVSRAKKLVLGDVYGRVDLYKYRFGKNCNNCYGGFPCIDCEDCINCKNCDYGDICKRLKVNGPCIQCKECAQCKKCVACYCLGGLESCLIEKEFPAAMAESKMPDYPFLDYPGTN